MKKSYESPMNPMSAMMRSRMKSVIPQKPKTKRQKKTKGST